MSYRGAITDIADGSIWAARNDREQRVRILAAAEGYVAFYPGGAAPMRERDFRATFEPIFQRLERYRSQFQMSLANLGTFRAYWVPSRVGTSKRSPLVARSVSCSRRFALPVDAVLIGVYSYPCEVEVFFDDLDDLLADLERHAERAQLAAAAG